MKKLFLLIVLLATIAVVLADEKRPDVSDFQISNRAGSAPGILTGPATFNRPLTMTVPDLTCSGTGSGLSGVGTAVFYTVHEIYSPTGENLVATISSGFDSFLLLYCDPFNPAAPLSNLRFTDDDDGEGLNSAFLPGNNIYLEPHTPYFLVVSSFSNGTTGNYTLTVEGGVVFGTSGCAGTVSLVGEFNNWGNDGDFFLAQDALNPEIWTGTLILTSDMNLYDDPAIIEVKFRLNADWAINWGATDFPAGIGFQDGPNIPVPIDLNAPVDKYLVTFNCATGEYNFDNLRVIPISDWALYLGLLLMVTFAIVRFKRVF